MVSSRGTLCFNFWCGKHSVSHLPSCSFRGENYLFLFDLYDDNDDDDDDDDDDDYYCYYYYYYYNYCFNKPNDVFEDHAI